MSRVVARGLRRVTAPIAPIAPIAHPHPAARSPMPSPHARAAAAPRRGGPAVDLPIRGLRATDQGRE